MGDIEFFEEVVTCPPLKSLLDKQGFEEPEIHGRMKGANDFLKLTKPSWALYPDANMSEGVNFHFECKKRGQLHLHIEFYPYEGCPEEENPRFNQLEPQRKLKAQLHQMTRERLTPPVLNHETLEFTSKGQLATNNPKLGTAVTLKSDLDTDCTAEEHANVSVQAEILNALLRVKYPPNYACVSDRNSR